MAADLNSRAEALKTNDQDFKKEVLEASKVLDAGLKCAMCGRAGFGSVEELGDHAAECFGEPVASSDAMTGDDDAAVLAEMLRTRDLEEEVVDAEVDFTATSYEDDERAVNQVSHQGKQVHADAEGDALVRQYQRSVDDQTLDPDLVKALVEYILYSSRRPGVLWCLHFLGWTRVHLTMTWVVLCRFRGRSDRVDRDAPRRYSSYDKGAILVFVSGWHDIERCQDKLEESSVAASLWVVPLHGSIESSKQRDAFRPPANEKQWKVVLATNVAETSVTIPDVSFVIDAGLEKIVKYDDHLGP